MMSGNIMGEPLDLALELRKNRDRPHLPGPHSFSYYRRQTKKFVALQVIETIDNKQLIN